MWRSLVVISTFYLLFFLSFLWLWTFMPFGNCLELKDITWNWIFLHHVSLRSDDLDVVQDCCGQEQSSDSGIVWQQRELVNVLIKNQSPEQNIYLRPAHYKGNDMVLLLSLLLVCSFYCYFELTAYMSAEVPNISRWKTLKNPLRVTFWQSLKTASRSSFFPPQKKLL